MRKEWAGFHIGGGEECSSGDATPLGVGFGLGQLGCDSRKYRSLSEGMFFLESPQTLEVNSVGV